ncbi:hypothetical protein [Streptomyces sp. NPDC058766]|uniref:hypothetical protein n=1 Tax=Streptomyces sp. NPDC058766 TaxID=3346630 RepID=UPI0036835F72
MTRGDGLNRCEQAASYGTFNEEPTRPEPEGSFLLDDEDRTLIAKRRDDHAMLPTERAPDTDSGQNGTESNIIRFGPPTCSARVAWSPDHSSRKDAEFE